MVPPPRVAYFSMEIGLESGMPTYSGGLGVLAGDTIRSAADLDVPMVAVSLLHRRGYFFQRLDAQGQQSEEPVAWPVDDFEEPIDARLNLWQSRARAAWRQAARREEHRRTAGGPQRDITSLRQGWH